LRRIARAEYENYSRNASAGQPDALALKCRADLGFAAFPRKYPVGFFGATACRIAAFE
jgi:hypothetical protein